MNTKQFTNGDGFLACDPKSDNMNILQGNVAMRSLHGNGKSVKDKIQVVQALQEAGYDVKRIKLGGKGGSLNPLDIDREGMTLEEKEEQLRKLLAIINYDKNIIQHYLQDMSFLDNDPEWKERAITVLQESILVKE